MPIIPAAIAALAALIATLTATPPPPTPPPPSSSCQPADPVETAIWNAFEIRFGEGCTAVRVARCEGWNAVANWDLAHISPTSDAGPFQINQIHGRTGGIVEGAWPEAVQTLGGNITAALELRGRAGNWRDWSASRHCHGAR